MVEERHHVGASEAARLFDEHLETCPVLGPMVGGTAERDRRVHDVLAPRNAWGAGIVLPETGMMVYPDPVVGVAGRKTPQGVLLAETKARTETEHSARKSRTEHRAYGNALMIRYDETSRRFMQVAFNQATGGNSDLAWLTVDRLLLQVILPERHFGARRISGPPSCQCLVKQSG